MNKVFLIGRLTRDPEIRFTPGGHQITSFTIAVNRAYKVNNEWEEEVYYFDVATFGYLAERLGKQLNKGTQVLIEGQLRQDRWETASGEKRSKIKVVADKVNILFGKPEKADPDDEPDMSIPNEKDEDVPF